MASEHDQTDSTEPGADRLTSPDVGLVVIRGASIRALAYGAGLALNALGSVFLLRYLSVDDFGRYMTVAALVAIVAGVSEAGLTTVGGREIALRARGASRDRLVSDLLGIRIVLTSIGVACGVAFAVAVGYDRTLVLGTALMGVGVFLTSAQLTMSLPLSRELAMARFATAELVKQSVTVAGIALLVALEAALLAFFGVQILVGISVLAVTPWLVGRAAFVWRPTFDRSEWRVLLRLAFPLAISVTISVLYFRVLVVLCSIISSPYETGLLATSYRVVELLYGVGAIGASVALPVLAASAHEPERLRYMTQRMSEVALLSACYLAVLGFSVAEPALVLLGGDDYEAAAPVLQVQVFALVPSFLAQVWVMALVAIGRLSALAIASSAGLMVVTGFGAVLIASNGAQGGAVAALAGEAALALVVLVLLWRSRPQHRLGFRFAWKAAAASVALLAAVQLVHGTLWLGIALGTAAFTAVALLTRAVPSEVRDAFRPRRSV